MKVGLFAPCYVDQISPNVAVSVVEVLEKLGHRVDICEEIVCCGQPAFNAGYWSEARPVAEDFLHAHRDFDAIIIPSGSCTAMVKIFYGDLFKETDTAETARAVGAKTWEFSEFVARHSAPGDLDVSFPAKVTFHDGCHGLRELGCKKAPRELLARVKGLELVEMDEAETCCGFGGSFAVKFPSISTAMAEVKCASAERTGVEYMVSADSSCLMHLEGWLRKNGSNLKTVHLAEILAGRVGR